MFNTLKISFQIDITCAIHSFLYRLTKIPFFKKYNLYKSECTKRVVQILAFICTFFRMIFSKFMYLGTIYALSLFLFSSLNGEVFAHIYLFLAIIGCFINAKILSVGKKKYYSVILMNMDAREYTLAYFIYDMVTMFFFSFLSLSFFYSVFFQTSFLIPLLLSLITVFLKIIGEGIAIWFYRKYGYFLIYQTSLYFLILIIGGICAFLFPYLHLFLPYSSYFFILLVTFIGAFLFSFYIFHIKDYKKMYKHINTKKAIMNQGNIGYGRQLAVSIRKKDYAIDEKKLVGKIGYDYFNTIFFLRHKAILSHSANLYAIFSFLFFVGISIFLCIHTSYQRQVLDFVTSHFSLIIFIMYFVNRGEIITQAMFYNCDRSMLTFNFYQDPSVVLNVFKERLKTVMRVNLRPALVIGLGLVFLFSICNGSFQVTYLFILLSVIIISVFFSVHYLVIYYLLQPYDVHMKMKSVSFSVVSFLTYFVCYLCKDIHLSFLPFSLLVIFVTIFYIVVSLIAVFKVSPRTFRLK